jgi:hypothetical protein
VEVEVTVGSARLIKVSIGTGVDVELPDVGVSGTDVRVEAGVSVIGDAGRLQDDKPMRAAMSAIQERFLIVSSFSLRIVTARLIICNSLSAGGGQ